MANSTKERLALALEALNDDRLWPVITDARAGVYDDYESESASPQTDLVNALRPLGHHDMCDQVINGAFDGTFEESQAWADKARAEDPEIDDILNRLGDPK